MVANLKDTIDKQRRDLDSMRKEVMDKDMLCSALRVCFIFSLFKILSTLIANRCEFYIYVMF